MEPYRPHNYQKQAIKFIVSRACAGLLLDPGLGKTSAMLAAFSTLKKQGMVSKMLVIAPLRPAYSVWPGEVKKWKEFSHLKVTVLHGPEKADLLKQDVDIYVINPEGLPWLFSQKLSPWPWDVLVVDESTRFKHANTQRFKTLRPVLPKFRRRYILTGSPAPNGLLDLFGQIYILDLGNALGQYITYYRNTYFDPSGYGGYTWVPREGSDRAIQEKLKPLVLRMAAEDYLELPPLINNTVEVELPEKALRTYKQMEDMLVATLEEDVVLAANAAAATTKCRQIANGGIYLDNGARWVHTHQAKTEGVQEIVEALQGRPALVAYEYAHDLERLRSVFPGAPHIGGGVSATRFREVEGGWNAGLYPVLLAQPQSVAHGLNLQGTAATVIWHSLTWDLEVYEQFIRRVWRQGQKERVIVHHIVAKNTVDEIIMKMLGKKDRSQKALLLALKSDLKTRRAA